MARYYDRHRGGNGGVRKLNQFSEHQPHHTVRGGLFPSPPTESEREYRAQLVSRMRERSHLTPRVTPEKSAEDVVLGNQNLPSFIKKQEIIDAVFTSQVAIVAGPTGSGKSTQVPQFLLEAGFDNVILTQPRIMASNGVGERIAEELCGSFDTEEARGLVAIQTSEKYENQDEARIFVRTDGLEQMLQLEKYLSRLTEKDAREQAARTVIVLDEVHESNVNQVGLLAIAHRLLDEYQDMRILVMSATLDTEKYVDYFSDNGSRVVPVVEIEGQPSEVEWLERSDVGAIDAIAELIRDGNKLEPGDDILLFTSGKNEIKRLIQMGVDAGLRVEFRGLDASMLEPEQNRVIAPHPESIRVIVSTDIAMTSLTFPHVKYVIDEGIVKNPEIDSEGAEGLVTQYCSQAEIMQRGGRAGRVRPGVHILVAPHRETGLGFRSLDERKKYPDPPIYSTDLSSMVLKFASYGVDFEELRLIDEVSLTAIHQAKDKLYTLGAIDEDDRVTSLGKMMNKFPMAVEYSRMVAEAMEPGVPQEVLKAVMMAAAAYHAGGLRDFTRDFRRGSEPWRKLLVYPKSDAMLELQLFNAIGAQYVEGEERMHRGMGLSSKNIRKARKAYRRCMKILNLNLEYGERVWLDGEGQEMFNHCVATGLMDNIFVRNKASRRGRDYYQGIGGEGVERELSNRTIVDSGEAKMVVGDPRFYMSRQGGGWTKVDIIEGVQPLLEEDLARLNLPAVEHLVVDSVVARDGVLKVLKEKRVKGVTQSRELVMASPEQIDQGAILEAILNNPGPAQLDIRRMKDELRDLQRLTDMQIRQFTQQEYEQLLMTAIRQSGSTELHVIDEKIRELSFAQGIVKRQFIAEALERQVIENAVPYIEIDEQVIYLDYEGGRPIAKKLPHEIIAALPNEVRIPDGRDVLFRLPKSANGKSRGYRDLTIVQAKRAIA